MRILITGPESSGKTTLARALSEKLGATLVPELARPYLTLTEGEYRLADLNSLAEQQHAIEQLYRPLAKSPIIFDTGALVLKIWASVVFGAELKRPLELAQRYDVIVLCQPDMSWEFDVLRSNPHDRSKLAKLYEKELLQSDCTWISVRGSLSRRLIRTVQFCEENKL